MPMSLCSIGTRWLGGWQGHTLILTLTARRISRSDQGPDCVDFTCSASVYVICQKSENIHVAADWRLKEQERMVCVCPVIDWRPVQGEFTDFAL